MQPYPARLLLQPFHVQTPGPQAFLAISLRGGPSGSEASSHPCTLAWSLMEGNDGRFSPAVLEKLLGESSEQLLHLDLANCHWITNESLESVAMLCPNLHILVLSSCDRIPPREFRNLSSLQRLQRLVLYRTRIDVSCLRSLCSFYSLAVLLFIKPLQVNLEFYGNVKLRRDVV
uniref:Uncharacterized protein n=1 Tax=Eptatretus burgeri TaxID=7764 RepID=A0A8C4NKS0_EPTBU